jgi:hypothetical protein
LFDRNIFCRLKYTVPDFFRSLDAWVNRCHNSDEDFLIRPYVISYDLQNTDPVRLAR